MLFFFETSTRARGAAGGGDKIPHLICITTLITWPVCPEIYMSHLRGKIEQKESLLSH